MKVLGTERWALLTWIVAGLCAALPRYVRSGEDSARFTDGPVLNAEETGVRIAFAVSKATDVAVEILNAKGETVRHLASGVLGPRAPEPLKKDAIEQSLLWDRKDDIGKPVPAGDYTVRVGLGLAPRLQGLAGWNPLGMGGVRGVAPMPEGGVVLLGNYWPQTLRLLSLDADGNFKRQFFPPPANAKPEDSPGLKYFKRGDGRWVPMIEGSALIPKMKVSAAYACSLAASGSRLLAFSSGWNAPCLVDLKTGGISTLEVQASPDVEAVLKKNSPKWVKHLFGRKAQFYPYGLALSPDGKTAYVTGMTADGYLRGDKNKRYHAVLSFEASGKGMLKTFVGALEESGKSESRLNLPVGLIASLKGEVYVCDHGNDRIAVFSSAGKLARSIDVNRPVFAQVHPKTGDLYVLTGKGIGSRGTLACRVGVRLLKLSSSGKKLASADLPKRSNVAGVFSPHYSLALDNSGEQAVVWIGMQPSGYESTGAVMRIEDKGDSFGKPRFLPTNFNRYDPRYVNATAPPYPDYEQARKFKYLVGNGLPFYSQIPDEKGRWGDGKVYRKHGKSTAPVGLDRFEADGKTPLPFEALGKHTMLFDPKPDGSPWFAWRGMAVDRRGHIYARHSYKSGDPAANKSRTGTTFYTGIHHYGPDGKKVGTIECSHSTYGLGIDNRGGIYVGDKPKPAGCLVPEDIEKAFDGKPPQIAIDSYGAVFKYGTDGGKYGWSKGAPEGKAERKNGNLFVAPYPKFDSGRIWSGNYTVKIEGPKWVYVGMSFIPTFYRCICGGTDLAVDPHGRVFLPDQFARRVTVLDAEGNRIRWIGAYGNMDSRGKMSAVPDPEIAFSSIKMVTQASSREVRVADEQNGWVSVISLGYAAEKKVTVKVSRD